MSSALDSFAPLDAAGSQLLYRFVAAAYEHTNFGLASHWPFQDWGRCLPEQSTAVSMLDRLLHHATVVTTEGETSACAKPAPNHPAGPHEQRNATAGGDFS